MPRNHATEDANLDRTLSFCLLSLTVASVSACGPKLSNDDNSLDLQRMEVACKAWCELAVPCSVHFAGPEWGEFTTQAECESICTGHVRSKQEALPACFDLILDVRECAAVLTCDEFRNYENWAFLEGYVNPVRCIEKQEAAKSCD